MNIKEDIVDKVIRAMERNEMIDLLEGKGNYKIIVHHWIMVLGPTYVPELLYKGIYRVYNEYENSKINILFEETLISMLDKEVFDICCALDIIYEQLTNEEKKEENFISPFKINRSKILNKLRVALRDNENELKKYFEWYVIWKDDKEGAWSYVLNTNYAFKRNFGISIL